MEAPENIYFTQTENGTHYYTEGIPFERNYIEYIRKDAFINKACEWLEKNADAYIGVEGYAILQDQFFEDFRKAMEE